jgi:hypothetical protein
VAGVRSLHPILHREADAVIHMTPQEWINIVVVANIAGILFFARLNDRFTHRLNKRLGVLEASYKSHLDGRLLDELEDHETSD